ncbi:hypothetical protein ACSYGO_07360 [Streptomyces krungchingensis]
MKSHAALCSDLVDRVPLVLLETERREDLLRGGIALDDCTFISSEEGQIKPRPSFLFSVGRDAGPHLSAVARRRPAEETAQTGGAHEHELHRGTGRSYTRAKGMSAPFGSGAGSL